MLAAVAAFAVMDASVKHLAGLYPPLEVACLRGLASIPFFLLGVLFFGGWGSLIPVQWPEHLVRGALAILMLWAFVFALSQLSLGTAYGIFMCAPLLITAFSALVLRARIGLHRWLAIGCGMVGVIIILKPDRRDMATLGGLAALGSAICYSVSALMIRRLARTDSTLSIALSFVLMISIGTGVLAYPRWVPVLAGHWPWILVMGFTGAVAQYLIIHAFRCAPPYVVAPFEYTSLLWGIALDWIIWSTVPSTRMLCGASLVIATGIYVIYREHWMDRDLGQNPLP